VIRGKRGDPERELSPHWKGVHAPIRSGRRFLGLWASAAVVVALLIGVFVTLKFLLGSQSDGVFSTLAAASAPKAKIERRVPEVPVVPRLSKLLAKEIEARQVEVIETATESRVRLGEGLFAPGSVSVAPAFLPVVRRVGEAVNGVKGRVVVEGYTDNRPIRTVRFPSNFELSQERALAVVRVLAPVLADAGRVRAEGLADANPIAPNDTEDNRRRNRRVEIVVKVTD
jgi:type VI secretion system protein ImpK